MSGAAPAKKPPLAIPVLPCPFCGEPPKHESKASEFTDTGQWHVFSCFCGGKTACAWKSGETRELALEAWNRRAPKKDPA